MSKTPADFSRYARSKGDGRECAREAGNFPRDTGKSRAVQRRCGRSSADTFEREPVVGAEMGGHGEARLAGPDTAISVYKGPGRLHGLSRASNSSSSRLLFVRSFVRELRFRFRAADRTVATVALEKIAGFHGKNRSDRSVPIQARARAVTVALLN